MQGIVIQGPTNYCKEVAPLYKDIPNVVWSTWKDEPLENIEFIKQYMDVVLCQKPSFPGYLNINMQTISTLGGVKYLQERGITEILKTRGDLYISNINSLLSILKGKKISLLATCKEGIRKDLYYELVYPHYSHDYPVDLILYGSTKNISNAFNFTVEEIAYIPPESLITYNLLIGMGVEFNLSYDYLTNKGINFFMKDTLANGISITWLKHNADIIKWHSDIQYYVY